MPSFFPLIQQRRAGDDSRVSGPDTDQQTILLRWKDLEDLSSIDHRQLAPLVDVDENRKIALKFLGKDAATVINVIDQALKQVDDSGKTKANALRILRKLAANTRQVPKGYLVGRWTIYAVKGEIIASGGFADVREGRLGGRIVAVRTLRTSQETDVLRMHKAFCKESVLWMNISHPNILKLIAVDIKPNAMKFSMISEKMENGNIMSYIRTRKADRLGLLRDVARGLQHLHGLEIIHGDLKGHNILIDNQIPPQACISDFGLSTIVSRMSFNPTTLADAGGTPGYMAPELYLAGAKPTKEADIYSFGIVVYEVITGSHPFRQQRPMELPMLTTSGVRPARPEDPVTVGFGQGTWELIENCWDTSPQQRPPAKETLVHFERVAAASTIVDPGPSLWARRVDDDDEEFSRLDSNSIRFSNLFAQPFLDSWSWLQQTAFAAHTFVDPESVRPPVLISPTARHKPNLWDRVRQRIVALKLLPSSTQGDT